MHSHTIAIDADQNPPTCTAGTNDHFTVNGVSHGPRSYAYVVDNGGTRIKELPVTANGNVGPTRTLGGGSIITATPG